MASFSDMDPVEETIGKPVQEMSEAELLQYLTTYVGALYDLDIKIEGLRERSVFKGLKNQYGDKTAGLLVKWAMFRHEGKKGGEILQPWDFSKGMKWYTDKLYTELQLHLNSDKPKVYKKDSRFSSLSDL
jgi:hypothetical protein